MKVFFDPASATHAPAFFLQRGRVRANLETPARAAALLAACRRLGLAVTTPPAPDLAAILRVHAPDYLDFLREGPAAWAAQPDAGSEMVANTHPTPEMFATAAQRPEGIVGRVGWYTSDAACPITAATWPAALAAAAAALAAAQTVSAGQSAYALCRPPGHHAYAARAGGHCYLNNAAITAEALRANGAARIGILDLDAHHGNGTQGIFWRRGDVFFASVHADPDHYYPWYSGRARELGEGPGEEATLNLPLALGTTDPAWLAAIGRALAAIARFGAEVLVVSLGFDAALSEPLAAFAVSLDGFARAGEQLRSAGLPFCLVQEGGYDIAALGLLLERFLGGLAP